LDNYALIQYSFNYQINATNNNAGSQANGNAGALAPGTSLISPLDISMAPYPLQNGIVGQTEILMNSKQVNSLDMSRYGKVLVKMLSKEDNRFIPCPSMDENTYAVMDDAYLTLGNPAGSFFDSDNTRISNGSWKITFSNNTVPAGAPLANQAVQALTITYTGVEPILIPPFRNEYNNNQEAIFGLNNLQINMAISQNLNRAFRLFPISKLNYTDGTHNVGLAPLAGSFTFTPNTQVQLLYKTYQTPLGLDIPRPYFMKHFYQFNTNFVVGTAFPALKEGANSSTVSSVKMSNVVSPGMPKTILLWADKNKNAYLQNQFNYYYSLTNLKVGLGARQNMLANFDAYQLNFLGQSFFNQNILSCLGIAVNNNVSGVGGYVPLAGCPIALIPGQSFPLPEGVTTNSPGSYTFNFETDITSYVVGDVGTAPNFNVMFIYDSWLKIDMSSLNLDIVRTPLTDDENMNLHSAKVMTNEEAEEVGGSLLHHNPDKLRRGGYLSTGGKMKHSKLHSRMRK
jgi:hypothetical protein